MRRFLKVENSSMTTKRGNQVLTDRETAGRGINTKTFPTGKPDWECEML
jgi:hypothetical protein